MGQHAQLPRPKWFNDERYAYLKRPSVSEPGWDASEPKCWLRILTHCRVLKHMSRRDLKDKLDYQGDVARTRAEYLGRRRTGGLTRSTAHRGERECTINYIRSAFPTDGSPPISNLADEPWFPVVEVLNPVESAGSHEDPGTSFQPDFGTLLSLRINLDAPDDEIRKVFERELARAREIYPDRSPARSGPGARPRFSPPTFDKWRAHKIVQVAELDWWARQETAERRPSGAQLGRWVFDSPNVRQPERQFIRAREVLNAALDTYAALLAQVEGKTTV